MAKKTIFSNDLKKRRFRRYVVIFGCMDKNDFNSDLKINVIFSRNIDICGFIDKSDFSK